MTQIDPRNQHFLLHQTNAFSLDDSLQEVGSLGDHESLSGVVTGRYGSVDISINTAQI